MVRTADSAAVQTVRGRDGELAALGQHLDQLLSGISSVVLLEGGAGMGKSHLLREMAGMARRLSIRVGYGLADPANTVVPLSVLMEALFEGASPILERSALGDERTLLPNNGIGWCRNSRRWLRRRRCKGPYWSASMTFSGETAGRRPCFGHCDHDRPRHQSGG